MDEDGTLLESNDYVQSRLTGNLYQIADITTYGETIIVACNAGQQPAIFVDTPFLAENFVKRNEEDFSFRPY